jgi:hypothetical protein
MKLAAGNPEAQPVQEPVAWWIVSKTTGKKSVISDPNEWPDIYWEKHPLYTTPPKRPWVGLTDDDMPSKELDAFCRGARWADNKLKEKNT